MPQACFPTGTKYRVVPTQDGDYSVEVWIPGQAPYAANTVDDKEDALAWIVAEQEKTAAADH